ncbi:acetyl-CoA acetyltransferase [Thermosipho melanesiensis]|uniref:Acetyl-CoA acetyltransferase n=2 Tax=Thermosipho melanesiensis TaxID=46541 RepID=A6LM38_THEM4|nr:acetyl-CoA C-acetyltransferase [Thermosipho melanesiensis]ABR30989.1 acetyl-CoA acetyltransferase [Thermosipho melanesiensis BI429]APT74086.1 acetyl-CoA acetyltransferase [Thermosipho melanesiensis]OOC36032.1 acetyl-CoA acetyltransferase [Thermosipho melanesiensis]OOC36849.1 acetyl-CoA acetyltransferase [Thermosipho melanesiensis]OOC37600.1 acetyl-CoA acetyltransferase [Thermosipho melanesiensis]
MVYILGAKRTAIGTFGGSLKDIPAPRLGAIVAKEAIKQANVDPKEFDETIIGSILTAGQGMGPGRQVGIYAGIPVEKPGYTVNMLCGSGMKATMIGAVDIVSKEAELVLTGGIENMSASPYLIPSKARYGLKFGNFEILDHMILDGLTDVFNNVHMGLTAENLAGKYKISREMQDKFAYESQMKAKKAIEEGKFKDEIVPVEIETKKGTIIFDTDEHPREVTLEKLSKLRPAFKKDGTITAGNASGINDGASAIILASEKYVEQNNLKPLARIISWAQAGVEPMEMGLGPVPATEKALKKAGLKIEDIELIELNEAFAAQSLAVIKEWSKRFNVSEEWIKERTNVNGGAIALGHPIGASGNRIIVTLLYEMKKRNLKYGLATLCIGGGMGTAVVIENI